MDADLVAVAMPDLSSLESPLCRPMSPMQDLEAEAVSKSKTRVKKVVVQVGGKDIELSMNQARDLHRELDSLFGKAFEVFRPRDWPWSTGHAKPYHITSHFNSNARLGGGDA